MLRAGTELGFPLVLKTAEIGIDHKSDPELDGKLIDIIAKQSDRQSGRATIQEVEKARDHNLVALVRALKDWRTGAGKPARSHEEGL